MEEVGLVVNRFPMNRPFAVANASIHRPRIPTGRRPQKRGDLFFNFLQFRTIEVTALEKW